MNALPTPEIALNRIREFQSSNSGFLDLGDCGLKELPEELGALHGLRRLNLGKIYLEEQNWENQRDTANRGEANAINNSQSWQVLRRLSNLRELYVHGLQLTDIPFAANLPQLEVLWLNFNQITDLNPIRELKKLKLLSFASNKVMDLSPCRALTQLRLLNASGNQIKSLAGIEDMTELTHLFIANNKVSDLSAISELVRMQMLWARNNKIEDLTPLQNLVDITRLILSVNQIPDIEVLRNLAKLMQLELAGNRIRDISPLVGLESINYLDLADNEIERLPDGLISASRTEIRKFLSKEALKKYPEEVQKYLRSMDTGKYTPEEVIKLGGIKQQINPEDFQTSTYTIYPWRNLVELHLNNNKISNASPLQHLNNLNVLELRYNRIEQLEFLHGMNCLSFLDLAGNRITDVRIMEHLSKPGSLDVWYVQTEGTPAEAPLSKLSYLDLSNNRISEIKPLTALTQLTQLRLDDNPIAGIPLEIAQSRNIRQIAAYYEALDKTGGRQFAEVKLIFVGNSTAGKTSISRLLRGLKFDAVENTTHGIQIRPWTIRVQYDHPEDGKPNTIFANIWDFGGQEYYHGTHRLFLVNNAVYVVVWEAGSNRYSRLPTRLFKSKAPAIEELEQFNYAYWLESIRFFATGPKGNHPPALLVQNKIDLQDGNIQIPDTGVTSRISTIEVHGLSAALARSQNKDARSYRFRYELFREHLIQAAIRQVGKEQLPGSWVNIREHIRMLKDDPKRTAGSPFRRVLDEHVSLTAQQFQEACASDYWNPGISAMEAGTLLHYLDAVGAVLFISGERRATGFSPDDRVYFDPIRITQKIYDVLNDKVRSGNGRFTLSDARKAIGDEQKTRQMLGLMARWNVIFPAPPVPGAKEDVWIAPQYLPAEHPLEDLFNIALSGLTQHYYVVRMPLFHFKNVMRYLIHFFGSTQAAVSKEFWKNGILFITQDSRLRVLIKGVQQKEQPDTGHIWVCVEKPPGRERETENMEAEIFREMVRSLQNERIDLGTAGPVASLRGNILEPAHLRKTIETHMQEFGFSRNGTDFVRMPELLYQAAQGISTILAEGVGGRPGKRLQVRDFGVFLNALQVELPAPSIFISYAHKDKVWLDKLEVYMATLIKRLKSARLWTDKLIQAGADWDDSIKSNLHSADIVILLVSAHFLASNYIWEQELKLVLQRADRGEVQVIPVLLTECLWESLEIARFEMVPKEDKFAGLLPVDQWPNEAKAFTLIARRIQEAVDSLSR